ncbi:hypothetical protein JCM19000A_15380 [Silvimonas sp. JCM 19000]
MSFAPTRLRHFQVLLFAYVVSGWLGFALGALHHDADLIALWLPGGVALVILLMLGWWGVPAILIGSAAVHAPLIYGHLPLRQGALYLTALALIDVLQAWLAMRAWRGREARLHAPLIRRTHDLIWFWVQVCLLPVAVTTPLIAALQSTMHLLPDQDPDTLVRQVLTLALAGFGGLLLVAPCYVVWRDRSRWPWRSLPWRTWWPSALICVVVLASFWFYPPGLTLILPLLLAKTIHYRWPGMAVSVLLVGLACWVGTVLGFGPFVDTSAHLAFFNLQLFLFSTAVMLQYLALAHEMLLRQHWQMEAEVKQRTEALASANARLEELATTDELTGVPNRREWQRRCAHAVMLARRHQQPLAVLLLDLDHFKQVNDTYGHLIGDLTLRTVSRACQESLRGSDSFGRWGGEEFVALLPDTPLEDAQQVAEKLRHAVSAARIKLDNAPVASMAVTVSIGVARLHAADADLDTLLTRADHALYFAKQTGRNRVVLETELPADSPRL